MRDLEIVVVVAAADGQESAVSSSRLRLRAWVFKDENPVLVTTTRLSSAGNVVIGRFPDEFDKVEVELTDLSGRSVYGPKLHSIQNDKVDITLQASDLSGIETDDPKQQQRIFSRSGNFRVLIQPRFDFSGFSVAAATLTEQEERKLKESLIDPQPSSTGWIALDAESKNLSVPVELKTQRIGFDGAFDFKFEEPKTGSGWLYALSGRRSMIGFVADDFQVDTKKGLSIFLPIEIDAGDEEPAADLEEGIVREDSKETPLDASEGQILDNPELFSDDPGTFCVPFRNPERILGERRFQTVLRSEQPEIFRASQNEFKPISDISIYDVLKSTGTDDREEAVRRLGALSMRNLGNSIRGPIVKIGRTKRGRRAPGPNSLIDWETDVLSNQAITVAGGHILEWSVRWRSNGYSLGSVNHTLTLAPRQVKRIVKVDFERSELSRREEITTLDDELSQATDSSRDYSDIVKANLSEWARGSSQAAAAGAGVGAGGLIGNAVVGGGAAAGGAASASQQQGARTAVSSEEQNLRDAIRQHGESLRQLQSTVITETNQRETAEGVSEIIANPNYCHALTIVYYDILRHLRVDTELAGVSECLFVPFTITPFTQASEAIPTWLDVRRVIRHRDSLKQALRDRTLSWVFPYLEDYNTFFSGSDVPAGRRKDQAVISLRGSLDIELDIASPLTGDEDARAMEEVEDPGADDRQVAANVVAIIGVALSPFSALGIGVAAAGAALGAVNTVYREHLFETEIAPLMARKFANRLTLYVNDKILPADFTLKGGYRKGGSHRVYFQVSAKTLEDEGITRADLEEVHVRPSPRGDLALPNQSVANLTAGRIQFSTETYRRTLADRGITDDLVEVSNSADAIKAVRGRAVLSFPASNWENENLRKSIYDEVSRLVQHLDSHQFYYHKAIWWRMDPDELFTVLDGYQLSETDRRSIASVTEYRPLAIVGNSLAFRVARGAFVGVNGFESLKEARAHYEPVQRISDPMRVSLPTGGVYAQALKDECQACEEHFGSTDWVLDEEQLTPQEIDSGLLGSRRQAPSGLAPTSLPASLIDMPGIPGAPAPSGVSTGFDAVTKGDSFRDMAGLEQTQKNALAALEAGASLAKTFGNLGAKQLNAERDAVERTNRSKDLSDEDKKVLKSKVMPKSETEQEEKIIKEVKDVPAEEVEVVTKTTGGQTPKKEIKVTKKKPRTSPILGTHDPDAWYYHERTVEHEKVYEYAFTNFAVGEEKLVAQHNAGINKLISRLNSHPNMVIVGYTAFASKSGSKNFNRALSEKRIDEIETRLHTAGIPKEKFPFRSEYTYTAVGEDRSLFDYLKDTNYPDLPDEVGSESGFDRGVLVVVANYVDWGTRKSQEWYLRLQYPESTGFDLKISSLKELLLGLLKMGTLKYQAYGVYETRTLGKVKGPLVEGTLRGRLIYAITLFRDNEMWSDWVPLNLAKPLATSESAWQGLSMEFYGGDLESAISLVTQIGVDPSVQNQLTSLKDSLDGNSSFKLKILNGYMNQSAVIKFNRTGNADGVFIAAHDKAFSRESVGKFIDSVIEKVSSGTGELSEKLQRGVDKVYDTVNGIPGVNLGPRPNVTLTSDEINQQLTTLADFFDLDEAMTLKIGAEKPKANPAPDPRPDVVQ